MATPYFPADNVTGSKEYLVHDNGGRPFKVFIQDGKLWVNKQRKLTKSELKSDNWYHIMDSLPYDIVVIKPTSYLRVFVGKDKKAGKKFDGSSVLVQLSKKKYMYIGSSIFSFLVNDEVRGFYSEVGNSDVIYAYVVGEQNIYLMIEGVYIPVIEMKGTNPYSHYYLENADVDVKKRNAIMREYAKTHSFKQTLIEDRTF